MTPSRINETIYTKVPSWQSKLKSVLKIDDNQSRKNLMPMLTSQNLIALKIVYLFVCKRRIRMPKKCPLSGKKIGNHSKYYLRWIDTLWAIGLLLKCDGRYLHTLDFPTKNPIAAVSRSEMAIFQEFLGANKKPNGLLFSTEWTQIHLKRWRIPLIRFKPQ